MPNDPSRHVSPVNDLNAEIRAFIDNWNDDRAYPFMWTKAAPTRYS
jgi:hypothetical protein